MTDLAVIALGCVVATIELAYSRRLPVLRSEVSGLLGATQLFLLLTVPAALVAGIAGGIGSHLLTTAVVVSVIIAIPVVLLIRNAWDANERRAGRR